MAARFIRDEEVVGSNPAIPTWLMCRLMGRHRAVKVGYVVCGRKITMDVEHRCTRGNCGSSPQALTNCMGFGTARGGRLPCKQEIQVGSIPTRSTCIEGE